MITLNEKQLDLMPFIALNQLMQEHPNKDLVEYLHKHFRSSRHVHNYTAGAWELISLNKAEAAAKE